VTLNFRSPKASDRASSFRSAGDNDRTPRAAGARRGAGFQDGPGVDGTQANITARLERIRVFTDPPVDAKFKATLSDYGAFLAEPETPFTAPSPLFQKVSGRTGAAMRFRWPSYFAGEKRVSYVEHSRITGQTLGWQKNSTRM